MLTVNVVDYFVWGATSTTSSQEKLLEPLSPLSTMGSGSAWLLFSVSDLIDSHTAIKF